MIQHPIVVALFEDDDARNLAIGIVEGVRAVWIVNRLASSTTGRRQTAC